METESTTRGRVRVEPTAKRVRALLAGAAVLDTCEARLVWENPYYPAYYVPRRDVLAELAPIDRTAHSPSRGEAVYYDVRTTGAMASAAAWAYPDSPLAELRDLVRFEWDALDEWLEEDELVYVHPRNPYTRVDILASSRRVQVMLDGVTLADSHQPRILFETNLPPRYYLPLSDLRMELLRPSTTVSHCPYKGTANYWHVELDGRVYEDHVWIYRTTLPESAKITGLAAFYNEKVDLAVDGVMMERPRTKFS
jgi:uncharacterized protein (DUF427 family)